MRSCILNNSMRIIERSSNKKMDYRTRTAEASYEKEEKRWSSRCTNDMIFEEEM